jgi:hypothetical protein
MSIDLKKLDFQVNKLLEVVSTNPAINQLFSMHLYSDGIMLYGIDILTPRGAPLEIRTIARLNPEVNAPDA